MTTATITTRSSRERSFTTNYTYENCLRVKVTTSHYLERKEFRTNVSVVWYEESGNFVIEKSIGSIFGDLFNRTIAVTTCNRYSQKNFDLAVAEGIAKYNAIAQEYDAIVNQLLTDRFTIDGRNN
jgi:hypothetical protein